MSAQPPMRRDIRPWPRSSVIDGVPLKPGTVREFRYSAFLGDPPPTLTGELVADIVITSVHGLEP